MAVRKRKGKTGATKARKGGATRAGRPAGPERREESAEFVAGLIRRGEAAYPMEDGRLPPGATHEIIDEGPGKPPTVVRRRFSLT